MTITTPEQMREAAAQLLIDAGIAGDGSDDPLASAIRAIPIAPQHVTDWTACAADMLRVWDTWFSGSSEGDRAAAHKLLVAAAFAAQAFEQDAASGVTADGAPSALLRAFLLALIDPLHPDLDYLRADPAAGEKARADRGAIAPPVAADSKPVAVTVKPLVWARGIVDMARPQPGMKYVACSTTPEGCWAWWLEGAENTRNVELDEGAAKSAAQADYEARILSALTIHPADPLSDPRVVALLEAATALAEQAFMTMTGGRQDLIDDMSAAIRAIGGEA